MHHILSVFWKNEWKSAKQNLYDLFCNSLLGQKSPGTQRPKYQWVRRNLNLTCLLKHKAMKNRHSSLTVPGKPCDHHPKAIFIALSPRVLEALLSLFPSWDKKQKTWRSCSELNVVFFLFVYLKIKRTDYPKKDPGPGDQASDMPPSFQTWAGTQETGTWEQALQTSEMGNKDMCYSKRNKSLSCSEQAYSDCGWQAGDRGFIWNQKGLQ